MNKKGFTLVELLAVIVILSLIVSIAAISITKTRNTANEKEKIALKQTIISAFENYRINNSNQTEVNVSQLKFTTDLGYNNKKCNTGSQSKIKYIIKSNKTNNINNTEGIDSSEKQSIISKISNSQEEVFCLQLYCDNTLVINDAGDSSTNEILMYADGVLLATNADVNNARSAGKTITTKQFKINYCK